LNGWHFMAGLVDYEESDSDDSESKIAAEGEVLRSTRGRSGGKKDNVEGVRSSRDRNTSHGLYPTLVFAPVTLSLEIRSCVASLVAEINSVLSGIELQLIASDPALGIIPK